MKKIKIVFGILLILVVLLTGLVLWEAHRSATTLITTEYAVPEDIDSEIRIALLSDLHNHEYGEHNEELLRSIKESAPDLIFMVGDMLNEEEEDTSVMTELIRNCAAIAPVYFSYGNHEKHWETNYQKSITQIAQKAGATVLDLQHLDVTAKGEKLRIGGYYGWYRSAIAISDPVQKDRENNWFDEYENTDRIKLLLCHVPIAFLDWEHQDDYHAGLAFTGHYHAGQILFPGGRGLFAPYVGWFPRYTRGFFAGEGTDVVLTAGLGSNHKLPRLNNPGELVLVRLVPEDND